MVNPMSPPLIVLNTGQLRWTVTTILTECSFWSYAVKDRDYAGCNEGHRVWLREIEAVGHVRRLNESASLPDFIWYRLAP